MKQLLKKLAESFGANISESEQKPELVARTPRVSVTGVDDFAFRLDESSPLVEILNISSGGLAIVLDGSAWRVGEVVSGFVRFKNQDYPVSAVVRHVRGRLMGCEFTERIHSNLRREIDTHLRIVMKSVCLVQVRPEFLKTDPRGTVAWFTDGQRSEIYCVSDADGLLAFHVSLMGNYVEGGRGLKAKTGSVIETDPSDQRRNRANLVGFENDDRDDMLNLARIFVRNADNVPVELRRSIESMLA